MVGATVHECGDRLNARAITFEQHSESLARHAGPGGEAFDLALDLLLIARITATSANRQRARIFFASHAKVDQDLVCHLLGEGAEGSPLAPDQGIHRKSKIRPTAAEHFDG